MKKGHKDLIIGISHKASSDHAEKMAWVGLHALSGMEMNPTHFSQRGLRRPYLAYPKNRPLRPYYLTLCLFLGKKNT